MMLLRFRFENHKSFRDATELTLISSRLKTTRPQEGSWRDYTYRVAGIYGANASGKSSVLDALHFMVQAIRHSATSWAERPTLPHPAFALDGTSRSKDSHYAVDVVLDEVRYEYGFSLSSKAISAEWLYDYPAGRRRLLFERDGEYGPGYRFGRALKGSVSAIAEFTGKRELFLSRAATSKVELLKKVFDGLTADLQVARFSEVDRSERIRKIVESLASEEIAVTDLVTLLRVADVGISDVEIETQELPEAIREMLEAMSAISRRKEGSKGARKEGDLEIVIEPATRNLAFHHIGRDNRHYMLHASDQSTGTLSWLSLAMPSLEALRRGSVLLVDEIDASLHPQLAQVLIQMFKDRRLNVRGAQLVFTTHDTFFLSPSAEGRLEPEEVWFTSKDRFGASELYSLGDFTTREGENFSRRYLHGRYGGTPSVAPAFISDLLASSSVADEG